MVVVGERRRMNMNSTSFPDYDYYSASKKARGKYMESTTEKKDKGVEERGKSVQ